MLYADTLTSHVSKDIWQIFAEVSKFMQIWEPKEVELPSETTVAIWYIAESKNFFLSRGELCLLLQSHLYIIYLQLLSASDLPIT